MSLRSRSILSALLAAALAAVASPVAAQVSLTTIGTPYTQNFDTLAVTGTANPWTDNSTLLGWYSQFVVTPSNPTTYRADAGTSNTGAIYSYGTGVVTERAFGSVSSGTPGNILNAVRLVNNTGVALTSLDISFVGEQWRNGGNTAAQQLDFQFQIGPAGAITDANTPNTGWSDFNALDFVSPVVGAAAAALDGNAAPNRTAKVATIFINLNAGDEIWLRWLDTNDAGNDHGLAVDDLSVTPIGPVADPAPSVSSILPAGAATNVPLTQNISITFSEPVNVAGNWFQIACGAFAPILPAATVVTGGPTSFTIDPIASLPSGQPCTVTVTATGVSDQDLVDPPDNMAGNFSSLFTTASAGPRLTINDVQQAEGQSGPSAFVFTVSLDAPPTVAVTFDIATADGSATAGSGDYQAKSLTNETIGIGQQTYTFIVNVNGDTTFEPLEIFNVLITNLVNADAGDAIGDGRIANDDFIAIHSIQGTGATSPLAGTPIAASGIVTALKSNGFFLQEPDASIDADINTSEGIFVFTSSAPTGIAVGDSVKLLGTVSEFSPSQDPAQPPVTEIVSPASITVLSSGNPLPTPVNLVALFPDPAGPFDQLETLEGMRVFAGSLTVVQASGGTKSEVNATSTTDGAFYAEVTGVPRAFREPGIQAPDGVPAGSAIPPIPRFDTNPEVLRVDSDGQTGVTPTDFAVGATVDNVTGVLDYAFRRYTILPDAPLTACCALSPTAVSNAGPGDVTVASYNLERFYNDVDDPGGDVALTPAAFTLRLGKASEAIRAYLKTPDIIGVEEVENLTTLQALAARISADAIANSQPDPLYVAFLQDGNDVGLIDVGFLVKTADVAPSVPRVVVGSVTQVGLTTTITNPNASTSLLNDRPPLVLMATVNRAAGGSFPITVIVNHLRSLNGVDSTAAGTNGWVTDGERVRDKRQKQAEFLANLIQSRQTLAPTENIVVLGDFNAFDFNDGYGDSLGVIKGTPTPDNQTVVPGDGVDLVNPDLTNLVSVDPAQRYSYAFGGNAQTLDHVLVSSAVLSSTVARRIEHPRLNADFPESFRGLISAVRLSDHDPAVAYLTVAAFGALPVVDTLSATPHPGGTSADLFATVQLEGSDPVFEYGFAYSNTDTSPEPGEPGVTTQIVGSSLSSTPAPFSTTVSGLTPLTTYHYQAYAKSAFGTGLSGSSALTTTCPFIWIDVLPNGMAGVPYSATLSASGGVGPYTFAVASLPPGLSQSGAGNEIVSGTPAAGFFTLDVTATDQNSCNACTGTARLALSILAPGDVVISEFRLRGRGGAQDEYIEIANRTSTPITVQSTDGGWSLGRSGTLIVTIPNGTTLDPGGHWLATGINFSLYDYPAGGDWVGSGDQSFFDDIPDDVGIGLFATSDSETYSLSNRLDAAGSTSEANDVFYEGTRLEPLGGADPSFQTAWVRRIANTGVLQDAGTNDRDFVFIATNGGTYGPTSNVVALLGGPNPEATYSPQDAVRGELLASLVDPTRGENKAPNRAIDSAVGTLDYRRTLTNDSASVIKNIRFKVINLTTLNSRATLAAQADLRVTDAPAVSVTVGGSPFSVDGSSLENPSGELIPVGMYPLVVYNSDTDSNDTVGGVNSTLSASSVDGCSFGSPQFRATGDGLIKPSARGFGGGLADGESVSLNLRARIVTPGYYIFLVLPQVSFSCPVFQEGFRAGARQFLPDRR